MSFNELKTAFNDYQSTISAYMTANEERLKEIQKKGQEDSLTKNKMVQLENNLTEMEQKMHKMQVMLNRSGSGEEDTDKNNHTKAFMHYIQKGYEYDAGAFEKKSLSAGTATEGGYMVPQNLYHRIIEKMTADSTMRHLSRCLPVNTDNIDIVVETDGFKSGWVQETAARDATDTGKIQKIRINVHEQYAEPRITQKLLEDAYVNVEEWIINKITDEMARMEEAAFLKGDGATMPKGLLMYQAGSEFNKIEHIKTGAAGTFKADDCAHSLIETVYRLKTGYLKNASWLMNRLTLGAIRKLKDSDDKYVWQPSLIAGEPSRLLGYPIYLSDEMPHMAEDSLSVAFGDFKSCYTIIDRQGIQILRDPFTVKPFVKFYTTKKVGGSVVDFDAVKLISFSA